MRTEKLDTTTSSGGGDDHLPNGNGTTKLPEPYTATISLDDDDKQVDDATIAMINLVETESSRPAFYNSMSQSQDIPKSPYSPTTAKKKKMIGKNGAGMGTLMESAAKPEFKTEISDVAIDDPNFPPLEPVSVDTISGFHSESNDQNAKREEEDFSDSDSNNDVGSDSDGDSDDGLGILDLEKNGSHESSSGFELFPSTRDLLNRTIQDQKSKVSPYRKKVSGMMKKSFRSLRKSGNAHSSQSTTLSRDLYAFDEESNENGSGSSGISILSESGESTTNDDSKESSGKTTGLYDGDAQLIDESTHTNKSKRSRRKASTTLPPKNTIPVKCVSKPKETSDFNPLLLLTTITKAHEGAIWCTSFSKGGEFFATGGMDGVLQIWEVAPSRDLNPNPDSEFKNDSDIDSVWKGQSSSDSNKKAAKKLNSDSKKNNNTEQSNAPPPATSKKNSTTPAFGTEIKILSSEPIQRFTEHTKDIVDISWSHTNFLLSASLDKTVRLWHHSRSMCLKLFRHADLITSVCFHPSDDRNFLSGGFDKKIRIWSIPDGRVVEWEQAPNFITAAAYQPDGKYVAAGLVDGRLIFYAADGVKLKYHTQMKCKNRRAKEGRKVTGLYFLQNLSYDKVNVENSNPKEKKKMKKEEKKKNRSKSQRSKRGTHLRAASQIFKTFTGTKKKDSVTPQVLVTTNDSRLRLIGMNDFCMVRKYKGVNNSALQIRAKFSESGAFIICGSETRTCSIWNTATKRNPLHVNVTSIHQYDKVSGHETFEATKVDPPVVTDSTFVPGKSTEKAILSSGMFPSVYDFDYIEHDMSSAAIVTSDYEGTIRVFLRRECLDTVAKASNV